VPVSRPIYLSIDRCVGPSSIYQFVSVSVCLSISLSMCLSLVYQFVSLSIGRSVYLSINLSLGLSIYQCVCVSVYQFLSVIRFIYPICLIYLSINVSVSRLSVCQCVSLSCICLSICLQVCLPIYLSINPSIYIMAVQPFLCLFLDLLHSRWNSLNGGSVRRKPATLHRTTQTQNKRTQHRCLDWDSSPRPRGLCNRLKADRDDRMLREDVK
jgi:hypothetical protein